MQKFLECGSVRQHCAEIEAWIQGPGRSAQPAVVIQLPCQA